MFADRLACRVSFSKPSAEWLDLDTRCYDNPRNGTATFSSLSALVSYFTVTRHPDNVQSMTGLRSEKRRRFEATGEGEGRKRGWYELEAVGRLLRREKLRSGSETGAQ